MVNLSVFIKDNFSKLPYFFGSQMSRIPYKLRPGIGKYYKKRLKEISYLENAPFEEKKSFILLRFKNIVSHAYYNIKFYQDYYNQQSFHPDYLNKFEDIQKIPIIDKSILQNINLNERSFPSQGRYLVNTGGSSGKPLTFYITPNSMGHEWAHMHNIWKKLSFSESDLKLTFGGRSFTSNFLKYDSIRHQYTINIYNSFSNHKSELISLFKNRKIKFLHGYPSAIYEFALFCSIKENADLLKIIKKSLRGVLLGSELPVASWRNTIENVFTIKSISWYGHTERSVLAYENDIKDIYNTFLSYGFTESVLINDKNYLVGTSYYNFASPFIRYNTEDSIEPIEYEESVLKSFRICEGRKGDFILDKQNKKIPLTGLIFGRHHKLFNYCKYIQVRQDKIGHAEILYVPINEKHDKKIDPNLLFDSSDININLKFKMLKSPIKSPSGKIKLLVSQLV